MIRRWLSSRVRQAHQDWSLARMAEAASWGTPRQREAEDYTAATRRRLDRWEALYGVLYGRGDR